MKNTSQIRLACACTAFAAILSAGCGSTTTSTQYLQPDINFTSKLPLRIVMYVSDSIRQLEIPAIATGGCSGTAIKMPAGDYYIKAIKFGLSTACRSVTVADVPPTHNAIEDYDVLVTVNYISATSATTVTNEKLQAHLHSRFETSLYVKYTSAAGDSLYAYKVSEEGFDSELGSCGDLETSVEASIKNCMHGLSDYVANSTYSAIPLNAYVKFSANE